ncbi:MAG: hypothetical protein AAF649_08075 [Verrucomicrobiota bacterium]
MAVYIAPIDAYDEAFRRFLDTQESIPYPDRMSEFNSHLFSMKAGDLINRNKDALPGAVFDFFNTIF